MAYNCIRISGKECDGCMRCQPDDEYYCPVCGEEVDDTIYVSLDGEIVGCENCVRARDPREMPRND